MLSRKIIYIIALGVFSAGCQKAETSSLQTSDSNSKVSLRATQNLCFTSYPIPSFSQFGLDETLSPTDYTQKVNRKLSI